MAKSYKDKLLDPRWQKKRLKILERDDFRCQLCGDSETTLHIHHKKYVNGSPWDSRDEDLSTNCAHCHSIVEFLKEYSVTPRLILKQKIHTGVRMFVMPIITDRAHCIEMYTLDTDSRINFRGYLTENDITTLKEMFQNG